jgi:hypothetical protein
VDISVPNRVDPYPRLRLTDPDLDPTLLLIVFLDGNYFQSAQQYTKRSQKDPDPYEYRRIQILEAQTENHPDSGILVDSKIFVIGRQPVACKLPVFSCTEMTT